MDNSFAEKLDTKRGRSDARYSTRSNTRSALVPAAPPFSLSFSLSASDFNGTAASPKNRRGITRRQTILSDDINVSSRSSAFIVYSIAPCLGANYIPPSSRTLNQCLRIMEIPFVSNTTSDKIVDPLPSPAETDTIYNVHFRSSKIIPPKGRVVNEIDPFEFSINYLSIGSNRWRVTLLRCRKKNHSGPLCNFRVAARDKWKLRFIKFTPE